jgi:hypothetical protein
MRDAIHTWYPPWLDREEVRLPLAEDHLRLTGRVRLAAVDAVVTGPAFEVFRQVARIFQGRRALAVDAGRPLSARLADTLGL